MSTWTPNVFTAAARKAGLPEHRISELCAEGDRQHQLGLPVLFDLRHLAHSCNVPYKFLIDVVNRVDDPYREFKIKKRSGGRRTIVVPYDGLKFTQKWIHENILLHQRLSPVSTAFAPGNRPVDNARQHCGAKWLVKVDIQNFFESLTERQVLDVCKNLGYPHLISFFLSRLCTRVPQYSKKDGVKGKMGHLPQGSPSSPMLANLICAPIDLQLHKIASSHGCAVTRYADDIIFSTLELDRNRGAQIVASVKALLRRYGLVLNPSKTRVVPPGARRMVTGLLVDQELPHLTKKFKERVELHLYHAKEKTIPGHCQRRGFKSLLGFKNHLDGLITFATHVDANLGMRYREAFEKLPWGAY